MVDQKRRVSHLKIKKTSNKQYLHLLPVGYLSKIQTDPAFVACWGHKNWRLLTLNTSHLTLGEQQEDAYCICNSPN